MHAHPRIVRPRVKNFYYYSLLHRCAACCAAACAALCVVRCVAPMPLARIYRGLRCAACCAASCAAGCVVRCAAAGASAVQPAAGVKISARGGGSRQQGARGRHGRWRCVGGAAAGGCAVLRRQAVRAAGGWPPCSAPAVGRSSRVVTVRPLRARRSGVASVARRVQSGRARVQPRPAASPLRLRRQRSAPAAPPPGPRCVSCLAVARVPACPRRAPAAPPALACSRPRGVAALPPALP